MFMKILSRYYVLTQKLLLNLFKYIMEPILKKVNLLKDKHVKLFKEFYSGMNRNINVKHLAVFCIDRNFYRQG